MKNHYNFRNFILQILFCGFLLLSQYNYSQVPAQCPTSYYFLGGYGDIEDPASMTTPKAKQYLKISSDDFGPEGANFFTNINSSNSKSEVFGPSVTGAIGAFANVGGGDTVVKIDNVTATGSINDSGNGSTNNTAASYFAIQMNIQPNSPSLYVNRVRVSPYTNYLYKDTSYSYNSNSSSLYLVPLTTNYRIAIFDKTNNVLTWVSSNRSITSSRFGKTKASDPSCSPISNCQVNNTTYIVFDIGTFGTTGYEMKPGNSYEVRYYLSRSGGNLTLTNFYTSSCFGSRSLSITDNDNGENILNAAKSSILNPTCYFNITTDATYTNIAKTFTTTTRMIDNPEIYGFLGPPNMVNYDLNCGQTSVSTATVIASSLKSLNIPATYQKLQNDGVTYVTTNTTSAFKIYDSLGNPATGTLSTGTYTGTYINTGSNCAISVSNTTFDVKEKTTTWNGTTWDKNSPTINVNAALNNNYNTGTNGSFSACNLILNSSYTLDIAKDTYVEVQNKITNNSTKDNLIVRSDGNLVQNTDNVTNAGAGITVYRDAGAISTASLPQYNYWSSPINSKSIKTLYADGSTPLYTYYYDTVNDWFYVLGYSKVDVNSKAIPGMGYAVRASTSSSNAKFVADLAADYNNGRYDYKNQTLNATNTGLETGGSASYNLVGNPYPSNLDLEVLYSQNSTVIDNSNTYNNVASTFLFWDYRQNTALQQYGVNYLTNYPSHSYAIYNVLSSSGLVAPNTGVNTNGSTDTNVKKPNGIVRVGQGFLVSALSKNPLVFSNSMRTTKFTNSSLNTYFFGKNSNSKSTTKIIDRFWLKITSPIGLGTTGAIVYIDGASDSFDDYDSEQLEAVGDDIYSLVDSKNVAINGKKSFTNTDKVILGTSYYQAGDYTISLDGKDGVFANGQSIYLIDKLKGIITNLQESNYTFTVDKQGTDTARFEIVYLPSSAMGVADVGKYNLVVYKASEDFIIKSENEKITKVEVYEMSGRLVNTFKLNAYELRIPGASLARGNYLLKINQNGKVTTKKIIK